MLTHFSSAIALFLGIAVGLIFRNPQKERVAKTSKKLLALSIVGLGAGVNLNTLFAVGASSFIYTLFGIVFTLIIGSWIGKLFRTKRDLSLLINSGTAICGGSAIAAISSTLAIAAEEISLSLVAVFFLNAVALITFPFIGELLAFDPRQYGLFCALAIHDTASVVGAALSKGAESLEIATTVKLTRTLWIIPLCLFFSWQQNRNLKSMKSLAKAFPKFIIGFCLMSILFSYVEIDPYHRTLITDTAKKLLILTLFLIGTQLSKDSLKNAGLKSLLHALLLWIIVIVTYASFIKLKIISI